MKQALAFVVLAAVLAVCRGTFPLPVLDTMNLIVPSARRFRYTVQDCIKGLPSSFIRQECGKIFKHRLCPEGTYLELRYMEKRVMCQPEGEKDASIPQNTGGGTGTPVRLDPQDGSCVFPWALWSDGFCYKLATQGPCKDNEKWFVKDGETEMPMCLKRPCSLFEVPHAITGKCFSTGKQGFCFSGMTVFADAYGHADCQCPTIPKHVTWQEDGRCYPLFEKGPCSEGFVLAPDAQGSAEDPKIACQANGCTEEGYAVWENRFGGDDQCHALYEQGLCQRGETFAIASGTYWPACINPLLI